MQLLILALQLLHVLRLRRGRAGPGRSPACRLGPNLRGNLFDSGTATFPQKLESLRDPGRFMP